MSTYRYSLTLAMLLSSSIAMAEELPAITDADREAAFPAVGGHSMQDNASFYKVTVDQLEWQDADEGSVWAADIDAWVGNDLNRFLLSAEGEKEEGHDWEARTEALWGHRLGPWWELASGIRHDISDEPSRTWGAIGLHGFAPYRFEVEAMFYVGEAGRTAARFEAEYELLITNRLVLQPMVEMNLYGKSDAERGIGSGLSSAEAGLRLRYEIRREFAPYVGVSWERKFGDTADLAGGSEDEAKLVAGVRIWF